MENNHIYNHKSLQNQHSNFIEHIGIKSNKIKMWSATTRSKTKSEAEVADTNIKK